MCCYLGVCYYYWNHGQRGQTLGVIDLKNAPNRKIRLASLFFTLAITTHKTPEQRKREHEKETLYNIA